MNKNGHFMIILIHDRESYGKKRPWNNHNFSKLKLMLDVNLNSVKEVDGTILEISWWKQKAYNYIWSLTYLLKNQLNCLPTVIHIVTKFEIHISSSSWDIATTRLLPGYCALRNICIKRPINVIIIIIITCNFRDWPLWPLT